MQKKAKRDDSENSIHSEKLSPAKAFDEDKLVDKESRKSRLNKDSLLELKKNSLVRDAEVVSEKKSQKDRGKMKASSQAPASKKGDRTPQESADTMSQQFKVSKVSRTDKLNKNSNPITPAESEKQFKVSDKAKAKGQAP